MSDKESLYKYIRENFYKKRSDEELQDCLYKLSDARFESLQNITDKGPDTLPLTSSWFDDILYKAKRVNNTMSPDEALQSDECLDKMFAYVKTKPNFFVGDEISNLKSYFRNSQSSVVNATKVANFSPIAARKIYELYCPKYNANILDYSCGFGARMLGCLSSPYKYNYYGIEPNSELNKRLGEFANWITTNLGTDTLYTNNKCTLYCTGSEELHEELIDTIDLSFSSPPYFNLEIYCDEKTQSANANTSYSAWKNHYMIPTIQNIYKYTKQNGLHIVNLKNLTTAGKEPLLTDWTKACVDAGFKIIALNYLVHQSRRQFDKGKTNVNFTGDKEPIVIFIKR